MRKTGVLRAMGVAWLAGGPPAGAAVTPGTAGVPATQASLTSDGGSDSMALHCVGGTLKYLAVNLMPCADVVDLFITGNAGNDSIDLSSLTRADFPKLNRIEIKLGTGGDTDVINGSQMPDTIEADNNDPVTANEGNDTITSGATVVAGPGDDLLERPSGPSEGGPGDDTFISPGGPAGGGTGRDTWSLDLPATATLPGVLSLVADDSHMTLAIDGAPAGTIEYTSMEHLDVKLINDGTQVFDGSAFSGDLTVDGRGGADTLIGGKGEDFLTGGPGSDSLTGGPGFDYVAGNAGSDNLQLRDDAVDRGACGDDADTVVADRGDALTDCESVDVPPAPTVLGATTTTTTTAGGSGTPAAPDTAAPSMVLTKAVLKGRRLSFQLQCPATELRCAGIATFTASGKSGRRTARRALGNALFSLKGGATQTLSKTLTAAQARAVGRLKSPKLALGVDAFDAAGNTAKKTTSLTLSRPRR